MKFIGKDILVVFTDYSFISGILEYADEFSAKYDYHKPHYFYIGNTDFKVSHVRKFFLRSKERIKGK